MISQWLGIDHPSLFQRLLSQAQSCLDHNARAGLSNFPLPALLLGGGADHAVGEGTREELAKLIPASTLRLFPELGHSAYEEAGDAIEGVSDFFLEV